MEKLLIVDLIRNGKRLFLKTGMLGLLAKEDGDSVDSGKNDSF
jgi:hypothetical protein